MESGCEMNPLLRLKGIMDTEAQRSILNTCMLEQSAPEPLTTMRPIVVTLCGISGEKVHVRGQVDLWWNVG